MIPTLLLLGFVLGHWWKVSIPALTIGWAVLLIGTGIDSGVDFFVEAATLAAINVVVGVLVFQTIRWALRAVPGSWPRTEL